MYLPPWVWFIASVAPVVIHFQTVVPFYYYMDSPSFTLLWFFLTNTFIPVGSRGVLLKSNGPSIAVCSNIVRFFRKGINIFKVVFACGMRRHQICIGNLVYVLIIPAINLSFHFLWPAPLHSHNEFVGAPTGIQCLPVDYIHWGFLIPHYPASVPVVCSPYLLGVWLAWCTLLVCGF